MNARLATLKRIKSLYGKVEEIHSLTLRQAAARTYEAENEITKQHHQILAASTEANHSATEGNHQQWMMARVQRTLATMRRQQLEIVKCQRELVMEQAREEYDASRIKSEQMKSLVMRNESLFQLTIDRKAQAAMDDRFLSRKCWATASFDKF